MHFLPSSKPENVSRTEFISNPGKKSIPFSVSLCFSTSESFLQSNIFSTRFKATATFLRQSNVIVEGQLDAGSMSLGIEMKNQETKTLLELTTEKKDRNSVKEQSPLSKNIEICKCI